MSGLPSWTRRLRYARIPERHVYLPLAVLIGALAGLIVVAFILLTEHLGSRMYPPEGAPWRRFAIPVAGSLITGYLLFRFFPAARGSGIPQTKVAMLLDGGYIDGRTVIGRFICSVGALASGIALGREGPSVQIGGGIASIVGRHLGLKRSRIRALIPVGAAAAVSAAFNTPIAGVLFALEEVMGDLHAPVLGSAVVASGTAWVVLHSLLGNEPLFHVPEYQLAHPVEFVVYAVLGVVGGLVSAAFVRLTLAMRARFLAMPVRTRAIQPVFGGLVVGALALWNPQVLGVGYDYVGQVLNGEIALAFVVTLLAMKLFAVAACYASGNSGGIFGPSLFLGAMAGAAVGSVAHALMPAVTANPGAYALVGMGAVFAGIVRVPLTSVFMIFELTRDYAIVVPLMIANMVSFAISRRFQRIPVYEALALQDGIHLPRPARERTEPGAAVRDVMLPGVPIVSAEATVRDVPEGARGVVISAGDGLPVAVSAAQLANLPPDAAIAGAVPEVAGHAYAHPDDPVEEALERLETADLAAMPVLDHADAAHILGIVTLEDVRQSFLPSRRSA